VDSLVRRNLKSAEISAADLKRRIPDVSAVARDLYQIEFKNDTARCPFPGTHSHGDRDPSLRHDRKKNRLFCASRSCFGEKGVDAIGLVQRMDRCSFPQAVQKLADHYGIQTDGLGQGLRRPRAATRSDSLGESHQPIPAESVRHGLSRRGFRVVAEFAYGARLRKVRFEHESARQPDKDRAEKQFRWEHLVHEIWYSGDGGIAKPLYVNRTFRERDQVGLEVGFEGEAKAEVASEFGVAAFSFKNITLDQAVTLADCDVLLWPDNDHSGTKQAETAAQVIQEAAQARTIKILTPPAEFPLAADIIDAINDLKWDRPRIAQFLETAVTVEANDAQKSPPSQRWQEEPDVWPKPEPLQSELPPVGPFHEDLLPVSFRALVADVTERMQVPMDFPAVVMVLCLAGAVNRRATIQPKANDTGWVVVPNLWGAIIASPRLMKSPVIHAATRPLNQIQAEWRDDYQQALKDYARAKEEHELRHAAWKEEYSRLRKKRRGRTRTTGRGTSTSDVAADDGE